LNTLKIGRFLRSQKGIGMTDYFTDEELEQIQAYIDFLLEIGTILGSKKVSTKC
jgi:hypothetical protein